MKQVKVHHWEMIKSMSPFQLGFPSFQNAPPPHDHQEEGTLDSWTLPVSLAVFSEKESVPGWRAICCLKGLLVIPHILFVFDASSWGLGSLSFCSCPVYLEGRWFLIYLSGTMDGNMHALFHLQTSKKVGTMICVVDMSKARLSLLQCPPGSKNQNWIQMHYSQFLFPGLTDAMWYLSLTGPLKLPRPLA